MKFLGIDIGGTKISVCVGTNDGKIITAKRMPTNPETGPTDAMERMAELCVDTLAEAGCNINDISMAGIAAPGPLDSAKGLLLSPPNLPGWDKVPLRDTLSEKLGCKAVMNNDANAGALAEFYFGREKGSQNLVYLTHSTGMGGGIIANGRLIQGSTDTGGEVGHMVLNPDGPQCPCGLKGCFEAYCGGLSAALRLQKKIKDGNLKTGIIAKADGNPDKIDFKAFLAAAKDGDAFALAEWEEYTSHLAHGIGNVIMTLNPDVIILGTIAVHAGDFLMTPLKKKIYKYAWKAPVDACKITTSSLENRVGDLGALAVAIYGT